MPSILPRSVLASAALRRLHAVTQELLDVNARIRTEPLPAERRRLRAYQRVLRAERNRIAVKVIVTQ